MKLNLEGKQHLITSGCSFTNGFYMKEKGSWAYYLSNMLDMQLHNQARGGQGNEYISNSIITYLTTNEKLLDKCIVGIAWSDISRLMSPVYDGEFNVLDTIQPQDFLEGGKYSTIKDAQIFFSDIPFCVYKSYIAILNLNTFLNYHNIPYFYIDAINQTKINTEVDSQHNRHIEILSHGGNSMRINLSTYPNQYAFVLCDNFNNKIFNNFLKLNQYNSILEFMFSNYSKYETGNPGHPNDVASIEVAEMIYKQII